MIDPADRQPSRSDGDGQLVGAEVVDVSATVVGVVDALLVDPGTRQGRWLRIDLPGVGARVVPIEAGSVDRLGRVVLPFDRQTLHSAPAVTGDVVTDADAAVLLAHFGFPS